MAQTSKDPNVIRSIEDSVRYRSCAIADTQKRDAITTMLVKEERDQKLAAGILAREKERPNALWCEYSLINYDHEKYGYLLERDSQTQSIKR